MVSTTTCSASDPVIFDGSVPVDKTDPWNFSSFDCITVSTTTKKDNLESNVIEYKSATTTGSSTLYVTNHITAGESLIAFFLLMLIFINFYKILALSLKRVKKDKVYLQYGGGDVEVRRDL